MANRTFANDGFWARVEEAIKDSGMSKKKIAELMGMERKALYASSSPAGKNSSWHSGRLASFCKITNVSADWLLGLTQHKRLAPCTLQDTSFIVIDKRTGKEPIFDHNHLFKEKWFKASPLVWCDLEGWFIGEDGSLVLLDECGNYAYPPYDRFEVIFI